MCGETQVELTCREAQLLLRTVRIDRSYEVCTTEQIAAIEHCSSCLECPTLSDILDIKLTCKMALHAVAWFDQLSAVIHPDVRSITEALAYEHLYGRQSKGLAPCEEDDCTFLRNSLTLGANDQAFCLLEIWYRNRWPLSELFAAMDGYLDRVIKKLEPEAAIKTLRHHILALRQAGFQSYEK